MKPAIPNDLSTANRLRDLPPLAVADFFERCMGNTALALHVLDRFEQQMRADIQNIEERLVARDAGQVARTAHALKGSAGAAAAASLHTLAARIELLARQDQLDTINHEFAELRCEVERCIGFLPTARAAIKTDTPLTPQTEAHP